MALIDLIFKRPGTQKRVPFEIISKQTRLSIDEVEHLIMKALSIGLIKGKIDQVENAVDVEWVQPRVLDHVQIEAMRSSIEQWSNKVETLCTELNSKVPELFGL